MKSLKPLLPDGTRIYEEIHAVNQLRHLSGVSARRGSQLAGTRFLLESGLMGRPAQAHALTKKALRSIRRALARVLRIRDGGR